MRRALSLLSATLLLGSLLLASPAAPKKETLRCTLTNTTVEKCCCQQREGKLYCPLAKKTIETCCCVPLGAAKSKRN